MGDFEKECWASQGGALEGPQWRCCGGEARENAIRPEMVASVAGQLGIWEEDQIYRLNHVNM